ncbi:hypothetical protein [Bacillus toyonensis]|uniref:hypothetical protein n=1 Tax=Bacillus toyonensis TaxID=155322 RepID=UPI002E1E5873|nr:hypothetical protein [Bacillus toyonensis]
MKLNEKILRFINKVEDNVGYVKVEDKEQISNQLGKGFKNNTGQKLTNEEFVGLIERIRFDIDIDLGNVPEIFQNMRVDINDMYGSINFYFKVATGVLYNTRCDIDEILCEAEEDVLNTAIEELRPMDLDGVTLQWIFWTEEQRKEYIRLLKRESVEKLRGYIRSISREVFLEFENELKRVINEVINEVR